jgi:hypothetical protein
LSDVNSYVPFEATMHHVAKWLLAEDLRKGRFIILTQSCTVSACPWLKARPSGASVYGSEAFSIVLQLYFEELLSVEHLASLCRMRRYREARELWIISVHVGKPDEVLIPQLNF